MKALLNICSGLDVHKEIIEVCILKGDSSDDVNFVSDITGVTSRKLLHHLADNGSISCTDVASLIDKLL